MSFFFQRWVRASSFGFSGLAFSVGKKPNVLDRAVALFCMPHNVLKLGEVADFEALTFNLVLMFI